MANDFSGDAACKALWRFENGAETADSKGSNTLTPYNTPGVDGADYKEGAQSIDLDAASSEYYEIVDASLDAGYPLKSGDTDKNISVCFWVKFDAVHSDSAHYGLYTKYDAGIDERSFWIGERNSVIRLLLGYNSGASYEAKDHASTLLTGRWYHVGVTYKNSDMSYLIRIWDDTAGAILGSDLTGTATLDASKLYVSSQPVEIGAYIYTGGSRHHDGHIDEVVVFNDVLTTGEIDQIRAATYGAAGGLSIPVAMYHYMNH